MLKVLLLLVACLAVASALHTCEDPTPYYGTYIYNDRAYPCDDGTTAQCVSVVFTLCDAPYTGDWVPGKKVNDNCDSIPTNTAIASFSGAGGTYDGNNGHAAMFLSCQSDGSLLVADQWCGQVFHQRVLAKDCTSSKPYSNCADYFYTIEW